MVHHTVHLLHSSISVDDELVRPMTDMDAGQSDRMPRGDLHSPASAIIFEYLKHSSTTYEKLDIVRKEGWKDEKATEHFVNVRKRSDDASRKQGEVFLTMMMQIGDEMQESSRCLALQSPAPRVLDICMAPGGYTASVLKYNPSAQILGLTLSPSRGGHEVLIPYGARRGGDPRVKIHPLDVTWLVSEFDVVDRHLDHPDAGEFRFSNDLVYKDLDTLFDLIICDGQALRKSVHARADYREPCEASRLSLSQLVIAMRRIQKGGTFIMLLHKIEAWESMQLLQCFSRFAKVQVFKPQKKHAMRSSFYMIARDIDPAHKEVQEALERWKSSWRSLTLDSGRIPEPSVDQVQELLADFGSALIQLGDPVWSIQLEALKRAPWMRDVVKGMGRSSTGRHRPEHTADD